LFARSGNSAIVRLLGEHGIYLAWKDEPSEADQQESERWVARQLHVPNERLNISSSYAGKKSQGALEKAQSAYRDWLRSHQ
jgi:hypothetical protein